MNISRKKKLIFLVVTLGLVGLLLGLLQVVPIRGDVGVQPILPVGSNIEPEGETPIQMAAETVVMNVRPATEADNALVQLNPKAYGFDPSSPWFAAIAEVQADFTMKNPTNDAVNMTAWFPLASTLEEFSWELNPDEIVPRIASFQVTVDGNPLDYTVSELPNPKGTDRPLLPWASFTVTFPAGKETIIHVSYLLPAQPSPKGYEMVLYYIFQTGAGWAGPIGQAELVLNLPYPASTETLAGMPSQGILEGNQGRWMWKDFNPSPENDFSIWLIQLDKWQEMETARSMVDANPQDGQAWLDLAYIYHSMATSFYNYPRVFSTTYIPLGIEAYQKAAVLLPEHPAPHAGLALLYLAPYMIDKDAPQNVIQTVQYEFKKARELEIKNPSLAEEPGISSWGVEDVLNDYYYNDATATVNAATWQAEDATNIALAEATLMQTPSMMTTQLTLTTMPIPSTTPQPPPTAPLTPTLTQPGSGGNLGQGLILILAVAVAIMVIVGFLVLRRK